MTKELLMVNPWELFGDKVAANPPMNSASEPASAFLHSGTFLILSFLACFAFHNKSEKSKIRYALWLLAYCGFTEFLQTLIPNRWPSGEDVLFNVVGLVLGFIVFRVAHRGSPQIEVSPATSEADENLSDFLFFPEPLHP
ncbi:MAG: VanZ family protein [Deltaproteobacteria bacterium]